MKEVWEMPSGLQGRLFPLKAFAFFQKRAKSAVRWGWKASDSALDRVSVIARLPAQVAWLFLFGDKSNRDC